MMKWKDTLMKEILQENVDGVSTFENTSICGLDNRETYKREKWKQIG